MGDTHNERAASVDIDKGLERDLQEALGLLDEDDTKTTTEEAPAPQDEAPPVEEAQQGEDQESQAPPTDHDPEFEIGGEKIKASQIQGGVRGISERMTTPARLSSLQSSVSNLNSFSRGFSLCWLWSST